METATPVPLPPSYDVESAVWSDGRLADRFPWTRRHRPAPRPIRPFRAVNFGDSTTLPAFVPTNSLPVPQLRGSPIGLEPDRHPHPHADGQPHGPGSVLTVRTPGPRDV